MSVNINQYDTLTQATEGLKARGFTQEFTIDADGKLVDSHDGHRAFSAEEVRVAEFHRFEGESDPGDMSVIYALSTPSGGRGLLIDAFGTSSDDKVDDFVKGLHVPHGAAGQHVEQTSSSDRQA